MEQAFRVLFYNDPISFLQPWQYKRNEPYHLLIKTPMDQAWPMEVFLKKLNNLSYKGIGHAPVHIDNVSGSFIQ